MATPCTNSLGGESGGHVRGDGFAGSSPPFLGRERAAVVLMLVRSAAAPFPDDDDDVHYYICWRLKLEGETENMGVCTKERKGVSAEVLMATECHSLQ